MLRRYYRRVWTWNLYKQVWELEIGEALDALQPFACQLSGVTWCQQPQPYVYEQWWSFVPDTIGMGSGSWAYLNGRINWGTQVEVA